jgi:hypothetical protein
MTVLVATADGYHVFSSSGKHVVALDGHSVRALAPGPGGPWVAVVDDREVWQHGEDGEWAPLAASELVLTALTPVDDVVYAGTVGAHVLRLHDGTFSAVPGFDAVTGRDEWHAVGPPLEVRSMTATVDGTLLVNVHVGGIPRSTDGGDSWQPTIAVDDDVHEVRAHPTHGDVAVAAASVGLCRSNDGGATWTSSHEGMHASYARAVAFIGDDVLVSASDGPFTTRSAIYRGGAHGGPLARVADGLPEWLDGNVDTACLAANPEQAALVDGGGTLWASEADGAGWTQLAQGLRHTAGVAVI